MLRVLRRKQPKQVNKQKSNRFPTLLITIDDDTHLQWQTTVQRSVHACASGCSKTLFQISHRGCHPSRSRLEQGRLAHIQESYGGATHPNGWILHVCSRSSGMLSSSSFIIVTSTQALRTQLSASTHTPVFLL